jgi:O-antigen ligase
VAVFIFNVSTLRAGPPLKLAAGVAACGALLTLVVLSWSRAAWLAGLVFLLLVALFRLSRKWTAASLIVLVAVVALVNAVPGNAPQPGQPYLARLAALMRLESPIQKDPVRLNLYRKAAAMIERRPLTGHGIGSFYRESVAFAPPNDPHGREPEFAHNALLQVAAELGLPAAAALAALTAWGLWRGIGAWLAGRPQGRAVLALGTALSLGAYLQTQMTANSLNVYASNQFFFWFLLAALLAKGGRAPRTSG